MACLSLSSILLPLTIWPDSLCLGAFVVSAANPCSPPRHEDTKNRKDDFPLSSLSVASTPPQRLPEERGNSDQQCNACHRQTGVTGSRPVNKLHPTLPR